MEALTPHWTEQSSDDFRHHIAADFALQIENWLESGGSNQTALAEQLNVSPARVSQVLNNPGNMTLRLIVEYARKLGKKVAIVAYDDGDSGNAHGPVNSQVFERCWQRAGRPRDFFDLDQAVATSTYVIYPETPGMPFPIRQSAQTRANVGPVSYDFQSAKSAITDAGHRITEAGASNG